MFFKQYYSKLYLFFLNMHFKGKFSTGTILQKIPPREKATIQVKVNYIIENYVKCSWSCNLNEMMMQCTYKLFL